jgi:hypothetical protein
VDLNLSAGGEVSDCYGSEYSGECSVLSNAM